MNIILHFPETKQGKKVCEKKLAAVHAEAVKSYLAQLPCSQEQKLALIDALRNSK